MDEPKPSSGGRTAWRLRRLLASQPRAAEVERDADGTVREEQQSGLQDMLPERLRATVNHLLRRAEARDAAAERRDRAAEARDTTGSDPDDQRTQAALDRLHAARDREWAAADRAHLLAAYEDRGLTSSDDEGQRGRVLNLPEVGRVGSGAAREATTEAPATGTSDPRLNRENRDE